MLVAQSHGSYVMDTLDAIHLSAQVGLPPLTSDQITQVVAAEKKRTRRVLYKACRCRNCGTPYLPVRIDQVDCSKACNKATSNREMLRGRMLYAYAYNWRKARGKGKTDDFAAMCRELDRFIREDREAGRLGPKGYDPNRGE